MTKVIEMLLAAFPLTYAQELGIDLSKGTDEELFKWFLAAFLFGARISEEVAKATYKEFERADLLCPDKILAAGWDHLVKVLDAGGYVRYDFSTADRLLLAARELNERYKGRLTEMHRKASGSKDLEARLLHFKGVGPTTTNIFLRELRGIWPKADPPLSPLVQLAAKNLKIDEHEIKGNVGLEAALIRLGKNFCRRSKCDACRMRSFCTA
jgi:endonuclease III